MPDRGYRMDGWRDTDEIRLRPTWFGLVCVAEQMFESSDGRREWRRLSHPITIKEARAK